MSSLRPAARSMPFLGRLKKIITGSASSASPKEVEATKTPAPVREKKQKPPGERTLRVLPKSHGERFWVFNHIMANHIVYSLTPVLDSNNAFRQLPYTGKKLVPAKLRKDYWRPLAMVEFGAGKGLVGRSVFQKLRELKKRHELEWDDPELLHMSRRERGKALNDQRGNMVADLAAVLRGYGKGNWINAEAAKKEEEAKLRRKRREKTKIQVIPKEDVPTEDMVEVKIEKKGKPPVTLKLHPATVYWANEQDKFYAQEWTDNVSHAVGLPENTWLNDVKAAKAAKEEAKKAGRMAARRAVKIAVKAARAAKGETRVKIVPARQVKKRIEQEKRAIRMEKLGAKFEAFKAKLKARKEAEKAEKAAAAAAQLEARAE